MKFVLLTIYASALALALPMEAPQHSTSDIVARGPADALKAKITEEYAKFKNHMDNILFGWVPIPGEGGPYPPPPTQGLPVEMKHA